MDDAVAHLGKFNLKKKKEKKYGLLKMALTTNLQKKNPEKVSEKFNSGIGASDMKNERAPRGISMRSSFRVLSRFQGRRTS